VLNTNLKNPIIHLDIFQITPAVHLKQFVI